MRKALVSTLCAVPTIALLACSGGPADRYLLDEDILGFRLGERKSDLFDRAEGIVTWERAPEPRYGRRGELYFFSGPLDRSRGIRRVRISFIDDHAAEIIVYYESTGASELERLRADLENRYGGEVATVDGTAETVYKTYRLKGPGMSITLRRITKKPETELYVQYLHNVLHERMREMNP